jgi:enoyl-CoA hydratase
MNDDVIQERQGAALWVRLNRPDALNGLHPAILAGIEAAMDAASADPEIRALVVTGTGRAFCAGADLKFVGARDGGQDGFTGFLHDVGRTFDRLEAFEKPVIAAVNGLALAGGLELVLCCDLVVAAASAKIGDAHANYGLLPGGGGSCRLPRRIGLMRAKHLFYTGAMVSAEEMRVAGLVNAVVPDDEVGDAVEALVAEIARKSPLGLSRMKQLTNDAMETPAPIALRAELQASELHALSFDMNEGLAAFAEKRAPRFRGA